MLAAPWAANREKLTGLDSPQNDAMSGWLASYLGGELVVLAYRTGSSTSKVPVVVATI